MKPSSMEVRGTALLWAIWLVTTLGWWALAFYPITPATADWLLRMQYVCFGSMPNGLPAFEGWLMLVGAPLAFSAAIGIFFRHETREALSLIRRNRGGRWVLVSIVALVSAEAGWVAQRIRFALPDAFAAEVFTQEGGTEGPLPRHYPRVNAPIPDFHLDDQRGKVMTATDLRGRITVLSFVFAHCGTVCPGLVEQTREMIQGDSNPNLQGVLVTLDPWRDTPGSLPGLAERWKLDDPRIRLLSGTPPELEIFYERLGLFSRRDQRNGDIAHAPLVAIVDRDGRIAYWFNRAPLRWIQDAVARLLRN